MRSSLDVQFSAISLPPQLWAQAAEKISNDVFDISSLVQFALRDDDDDDDDCVADDEGLNRLRCPLLYDLHVTDDIKANSCVFLIDHMWTTTFPQAKRELRAQPQLLQRLATILKVDGSDEQEVVAAVFDKMWPRVIAKTGEADMYTEWYCFDEVGMSIQHSASPSFRLCPITVCSPHTEADSYSLTLAWPVADLETGRRVTRDFLPTVPTLSPTRALRLIAFWDREYLLQCNGDDALLQRVLGGDDDGGSSGPGRAEQVPTEAESSASAQRAEAGGRFVAIEERLLSLPPPLKVYCDRNDHLRSDLLRGDTVTIVSSAAEADALYLIDHTLDEQTGEEVDRRGKVVNQFWWEGMLVSKEHLLRSIGGTADGAAPAWFPTSYDLSYTAQLRAFIRASLSSGSDAWILKRYRGRHSIDYPITRSLSCALRHLESAPRIAAAYIKPCLFAGRKFDLRFYVTVHSLEPLQLYRYDSFSVRLANEPYDGQDLESYQSNFTVMSFLDDERLSQVRGRGLRSDPSMEDFIESFDAQRGSGAWLRVQQLVDEALVGVFAAAQRGAAAEALSHPAGLGAALHPNSCWSFKQPNASPAKAMYGVDVMLSQQLQPMLLEVQYGPDCDRILRHRQGFWSQVLENLFLQAQHGFIRLA